MTVIFFLGARPRYHIGTTSEPEVNRIEYQDSCLRGGTNLSELWEQGNAMLRHGFRTEAARIIGKSDNDEDDDDSDAYDVGSPTVKTLLECKEGEKKWDYVIFNDHTQGPARVASRQRTEQTLLENYLPLLRKNEAVPIIIETAAYRYPDINNSHDLGDTNEFQQRVKEGVESYGNTLLSKLSKECRPRIAPVGTAFLHVHDTNHELWTKLFDPSDHFHPSPSGTFLQGCLLHCTMFGCPPSLPKTDEDIEELWRDARMMHDKSMGDKRELPNVEEITYLWNAAKMICGCS